MTAPFPAVGPQGPPGPALTNRGRRYLRIAGAATGYTTPDHATLDITGAIDLRVLVIPDNWASGANQELVTKWNATGGQQSYRLEVTGVGHLNFVFSTTGADTVSIISTKVLSTLLGPSNLPVWVRVRAIPDDGTGKSSASFYFSYSPDDTTAGWTLVDTVTSATPGPWFSSTATVHLGETQTGGSPYTGRLYRAKIYDDTALAADFDARGAADPPATFTGSTGKVWTPQAGAALLADEVSDWDFRTKTLDYGKLFNAPSPGDPTVITVRPTGAGGDQAQINTALVAASLFLNGGTVRLGYPSDVFNCSASIIAQPGVTLDIPRGVVLQRGWNGTATAAQALIRNPSVTDGSKVTGFRISGAGTITANTAGGNFDGDIIALYGDNMVFRDYTVDGYASNTSVGGICHLIGGDGVRGWNVTVKGSGSITTTGGVRFFGGKNFRWIGGSIESGDDALQFAPLAINGGTSAWNNLSISDAYYIGVVGGSIVARFMVALLQEPNASSTPGDLTNSITDFGWTDCTGYCGNRAIVISNTDSSGQISDGHVVNPHISVLQHTGAATNEVIVEAVGSGSPTVPAHLPTGGRVKRITFTNPRIGTPFRTTLAIHGQQDVGTGENTIDGVTWIGGKMYAPSTTGQHIVYSTFADNLRIEPEEIDCGGGTANALTVDAVSFGISSSPCKNCEVRETRFKNVPNGVYCVTNLGTAKPRVWNIKATPASGTTTANGISFDAACTKAAYYENELSALTGTKISDASTGAYAPVNYT